MCIIVIIVFFLFCALNVHDRSNFRWIVNVLEPDIFICCYTVFAISLHLKRRLKLKAMFLWRLHLHNHQARSGCQHSCNDCWEIPVCSAVSWWAHGQRESPVACWRNRYPCSIWCNPKLSRVSELHVHQRRICGIPWQSGMSSFLDSAQSKHVTSLEVLSAKITWLLTVYWFPAFLDSWLFAGKRHQELQPNLCNDFGRWHGSCYCSSQHWNEHGSDQTVSWFIEVSGRNARRWFASTTSLSFFSSRSAFGCLCGFFSTGWLMAFPIISSTKITKQK